MTIVGLWETGETRGTVATTYSWSFQHNFTSPQNIWSRPYLQAFYNKGSDASATLGISQFIDNQGVHNGNFHPGLFASNCTSVTFSVWTQDTIVRTVFTTVMFG